MLLAREESCYEYAVLRSKFEENKNVKDIVKATKLLEEGERFHEEIKHPVPLICE